MLRHSIKKDRLVKRRSDTKTIVCDAIFSPLDLRLSIIYQRFLSFGDFGGDFR